MTGEVIESVLSEDRKEWLESLEYIIEHFGEEGALFIFNALVERLKLEGVSLADGLLNTPYINSIPANEEVAYPGDLNLEKKIENINRWNSMAMVLQGQDSGHGVGGHIATYASIATVFEIAFKEL